LILPAYSFENCCISQILKKEDICMQLQLCRALTRSILGYTLAIALGLCVWCAPDNVFAQEPPPVNGNIVNIGIAALANHCLFRCFPSNASSPRIQIPKTPLICSSTFGIKLSPLLCLGPKFCSSPNPLKPQLATCTSTQCMCKLGAPGTSTDTCSGIDKICKAIKSEKLTCNLSTNECVCKAGS